MNQLSEFDTFKSRKTSVFLRRLRFEGRYLHHLYREGHLKLRLHNHISRIYEACHDKRYPNCMHDKTEIKN